MCTVRWWLRTLIIAHLAVSAEVRSTSAPAILPSSVDIRPLRTWIRSLDASPFLAHVARLTRKAVLTVADLIGHPRVIRTGGGIRDFEAVIGKEVTVLVVKAHLADRSAKTLGSFVGNLHVFAILRRRLAEVG